MNLPERGEVKKLPAKALTCTIEPQAPQTVGSYWEVACDASVLELKDSEALSLSLENRGQGPEYVVALIGTPALEGSTLKIKITSYRPGQHELNGLVLKAKTDEFLISPLKVDVQSVIEGQQAPTPFPNHAPEALWAPLWWWILWGTILALILGYSLWRYLAFKKKKKALEEKAIRERPLTAREKFQSRMRKLESQNFHMEGKFKSFALELSQIIKSTIGSELHFPADDLTTEELLSTLQARHKKVYAALEKDFKPLLLDLDQIKFAKKMPTPDECRAHLDRAYAIGRILFGGSV